MRKNLFSIHVLAQIGHFTGVRKLSGSFYSQVLENISQIGQKIINFVKRRLYFRISIKCAKKHFNTVGLLAHRLCTGSVWKRERWDAEILLYSIQLYFCVSSSIIYENIIYLVIILCCYITPQLFLAAILYASLKYKLQSNSAFLPTQCQNCVCYIFKDIASLLTVSQELYSLLRSGWSYFFSSGCTACV